MPKPAWSRATARGGRDRRLFAAGAVLAAVGSAVGFATISNAATTDTPLASGAGKVVNGQVILTDTCEDSRLAPHDGFQKGDRCVSTEFGEVGVAADNPSLLITEAPRVVAPNTAFTLRVSTRNLIRDRFLAAGQGGYYVESSVLRNGLVRGHFHTACRMLTSTNAAPAPDPVPAFFVATEDGRGSARPDVVTIQVAGLPATGIAQCASWAGDGSHRIPMMERANQTPALDAVRITVRAGQQGGGANGGGANGGGANGGANNGGANGGGANGGGANGGGANGGGQQGGGNNGATSAPAAPAAPAQGDTATTKNDFTPSPTTPAATTAPASTSDNTTSGNTTKSGTAAKPATTSTTGPANADSAGEPAAAAEPTATKSSKTATDFTYSSEDGQFNSGNQEPVAEQVANAKAAAEQKTPGLLARTGTNTFAAIGGGAVLLLIGLIIMAFTRRRKIGGTSWQ